MKNKLHIILLALLCVSQQQMHAISVGQIASKCFNNVVINIGKIAAGMMYTRFMFSRGQDTMTQEQTARMAGSHVPIAQSVLSMDIPIAEGTVPPAIQNRIVQLKRNNYSWPICKPILMCGVPGTGKTKLAHHIAKEAQLPFYSAAAPSFVGAHCNSGPENMCTVFKNARRRPMSTSIANTFRRFGRWILRRPAYVRKPSVILIDEIDAFAKPVRDINSLLPGDQQLENERRNTLKRLFWEMSRNPLAENNLRCLNCPPADWFEKYMYSMVHPVIAAGRTAIQALGGGRDVIPESIEEQVVAASVDQSLQFEDPFARGFIQGIFNPPYIPLRGSMLDKLDIFMRNLYLKCFSAYNRFNFWLCRWMTYKGKTDALVIATTNKRAHELDLRMRDFFEIIEMHPFNQEQRLSVLQFHARGKQLADGIDLQQLSAGTAGFTGDELAALLKYAANYAAENDAQYITQEDVDRALQEIVRLRNNRQEYARHRMIPRNR